MANPHLHSAKFLSVPSLRRKVTHSLGGEFVLEILVNNKAICCRWQNAEHVQMDSCEIFADTGTRLGTGGR
jgi:hypothetical protein